MSPGDTPKILHQTWAVAEVPAPLKKFVDSCKRANRDYTYQFHTDKDLEELIKYMFPQYWNAYVGFSRQIERVHFARYALLWWFGGVYADIDAQCVRNFDKQVALNCPVFGNEPVERREALYDGRSYVLGNSIMISPPRHPIWIDIMNNVVKNYVPGHDPDYNTGPMMLTNLYDTRLVVFTGTVVLPACVFYEQNDEHTAKANKTDKKKRSMQTEPKPLVSLSSPRKAAVVMALVFLGFIVVWRLQEAVNKFVF